MRQFIAAACLLASAPLSAAQEFRGAWAGSVCKDGSCSSKFDSPRQEFLARGPAEPLPPAGEGYVNAGPGVCHFRGRAPVGEFLASVGQQQCQELCTADAACWGFSRDPASGACALFRQGPLAGGGPAWGGAGCSVKASGRAEAAAAGPPRATRAPANQAPAETAYEVEGAGPCTVGGRLPLAEAHPSAHGATACRSLCTARADCYGYEAGAAAGGACRILAEGPLAGSCARKVQEPKPSAGTLYEDAGAGACRSGEGGKARLLPGLSASECAVRCTLVSDCKGFSSAADACVIFTGAQLSAGGGAWGYARCQRKAANRWG